MNTITIRGHLFATALVLLALGACSDSGSILGLDIADNSVQVSNVEDAFHWQASSLADVTDTETYSWTITTTTASVSHSNAALSGTATVTVTDADGTQVYTSALSDASVDATTTAGTAGTWTVVVTLSGATTDHINFQLADAT